MTNIPQMVILATDSEMPSGVGEHMLTLANELTPNHDVALFFSPQGDGARFLVRGSEAGFRMIALDESFSGWLHKRRPAVLHVHAGIGWEGHALVEAGWKAGINVVRTEHLPYMLTDPEQKSQHRRTASLADTIVAVSDASAKSYQAEGFTNIATILNGIETPMARRTRRETRATLAVADDTPLIIMVARFTAQKGHDCLLRAAAGVSRQIPRVNFVLVGDGPERSRIEALAALLRPGKFTFLGERKDVADLLIAADLLVLPSLFEGLPLVVLEAMALSLPVVATRIGGTVEALGNEHPFLAVAGDPWSLADTIVAALSNETRRRTVGMAERQRFEQHFTAARMGQETASVYRAIGERMRVA